MAARRTRTKPSTSGPDYVEAAWLGRLTGLAEALGTARDLPSVLRALRDVVLAATPSNTLFVSLYDPDRQLRTCAYAWSEGDEVDVSSLPPMPMTDSPHSRAVATNDVVVCDDFQAAISGQPRVDIGMEVNARLPRAAVAVPMAVLGRVVGGFEVQSPTLAAYTPEHVALLRLVATMTAAAIENVRLYEAEHAARRVAESAVAARDEFLSIAAHELKTPMTTLRGTVQLGLRRLELDGQVDEKRLERYLRTVNEQSGKLVRLTDQLLDVSRIETGQLSLERRDVDVVALAGTAVEAAQARTDRHRIALSSDAPALRLSADPLRLEQVLTNLLENALKYSPDGGEIHVAVESADPSEVAVSVRDHGLGVPPEHLPHIFERLYQGHTLSYAPGLGLGLYVCRQIVELHGGSILVESPRGGGTRFVVKLPR
ncbi:MAG TPA: GAF domain-containing sensor histidine kinase [Chloroflexota bacterium]|nr:GAF domain-containing sensor histidine kinase [Chloroflexota bacterium]